MNQEGFYRLIKDTSSPEEVTSLHSTGIVDRSRSSLVSIFEITSSFLYFYL